jgi:hypothetical protein
MFVVTADQIGSRGHDDVAGEARDSINERYGPALALPADRNAGDEIQMLTGDPTTALELVLDLTRTGKWSVGLGCGVVRKPLPQATREASGPAFFSARDAVLRAKRRQTRFAVDVPTEPHTDQTERANTGIAAAAHADSLSTAAQNTESLIDLLLVIRARRTDPGWELFDLLASGLTQQDAATRLSISPPAASSRAHAANIKQELAAIPALTKLLQDLDQLATETDGHP